MREKANLFLFIVLTGLAFYYKGWHEGFASTFIFYVLLFITVYETLLLVTMYGIQVEREIEKKRLIAGGEQRIKIRVRRKYPIPFVWYMIYDQRVREEGEPHRQFIFPWLKKEIDTHYLLSDLNRGFYQLKEVKIETGDIFGLLRISRSYPIESRFMVLPYYTTKQQWTANEREHSGETSLSRRPSTDLSSLSGMRDYQYGDRLSQIHWRASARTQTLKTKEYESLSSDQFTIFLDTGLQSYPLSEQFEQAVSLTASIMYIALRRKIKFSLQTGAQGPKLRTKEGSLDEQFNRYLEYLAMIQLDSEVEFQEMISQNLSLIPKGTHLAVITSKVDRSLSALLGALASQKWKVELYYVSTPHMGWGDEWITTLQANGVICHRESA